MSVYGELLELYVGAQRAIHEARTLAADSEFIRWWYGMRAKSVRPPVRLLDD
jgi:hypothetical protein